MKLIRKLPRKAQTEALAKLEKVVNLIPSADVLDFFNKLTEAYKEDQITKREIAKIEAQKDFLLTVMREKYALYHTVFDKIFEERGKAINKSFEIIDKGIKENDKDLISVGLQTLSKVVSSSPFANIAELSNALENNNLLEI